MTAEDYTQAAALVTEECHRALTAIEPVSYTHLTLPTTLEV